MKSFEIISSTNELEASILIGLRKALNGIEKNVTLVCKIEVSSEFINYLLGIPKIKSIILSRRADDLIKSNSCVGYYYDNGRKISFPKKIETAVVYIGPSSGFRAVTALQIIMRGGHWIIFCVNPFLSLRTHLIFFFLGRVYSSALSDLSLILRLRFPNNKFLNYIFKIQTSYQEKKISSLLNALVPIIQPPNEDDNQTGVVIVGSGLGPGGAERQLINTIVGLNSHGISQLHFLHYWPMEKPNNFYFEKLVENKISYSRLRLSPISASSRLSEKGFLAVYTALGLIADDVFFFLREFEERAPSIVHVWLDDMNVKAGLAALIAGVPRIILSCRSMAPDHFVFHKPYMKPIYDFLTKFDNVYFLNNSKAGAMDYKRWLKNDKININIINNGFDFSTTPKEYCWGNLRKDYRSSVNIPEGVAVIGVIMRLSEEKRPHLWVKVAKSVLTSCPNTHFLIIGDGYLRNQLELSVAAPEFQKFFHFVGVQKNIFPALLAMDIFLLTSRVEGLPNVLIEAQSVGVPVVTVDVGGASETLNNGKSGHILSTLNSHLISREIISILQNKEWISRAALESPLFVRAQFSMEKMLSETIKIYKYGSKS